MTLVPVLWPVGTASGAGDASLPSAVRMAFIVISVEVPMRSYRRVSSMPSMSLMSLMTAIAVTGLATTLAVAPAVAATAPLSQPEVVAHLDLGTGQQPENIAGEPDCSVN